MFLLRCFLCLAIVYVAIVRGYMATSVPSTAEKQVATSLASTKLRLATGLGALCKQRPDSCMAALAGLAGARGLGESDTSHRASALRLTPRP